MLSGVLCFCPSLRRSLLSSPPGLAVRAHSFELLGRHKARKKRDRGFVWSGNKRRCRDRPQDAIAGRLLASSVIESKYTVIYLARRRRKLPRLARNRAFVICLEENRRASLPEDGSRTLRSLNRVHIGGKVKWTGQLVRRNSNSNTVEQRYYAVL